jgi:hypothetical protein
MTASPGSSDFELDLERRIFPTRAARTEIRRFVASYAIGLVLIAGDLVEEAVRAAVAAGSAGLFLRAAYRDATLFIEITDTNARLAAARFNLVEAQASAWEAVTGGDGSRLTIELRRR